MQIIFLRKVDCNIFYLVLWLRTKGSTKRFWNKNRNNLKNVLIPFFYQAKPIILIMEWSVVTVVKRSFSDFTKEEKRQNLNVLEVKNKTKLFEVVTFDVCFYYIRKNSEFLDLLSAKPRVFSFYWIVKVLGGYLWGERFYEKSSKFS